MTKRVVWLIVTVIVAWSVIAVIAIALSPWNELPQPYVLPPPLTAEESAACKAIKPSRNATLEVDPARACWKMDRSKIEICLRRTP